MYITDAKSKLSIVRKRRATHAIVMIVVSWKQLRWTLVQVLVQRRRSSSMFFPRVDEPQRQRAKGISPFVGTRVPCFHYTYVHGGPHCREGAEGAGVAPRRATMPACTDARMCCVLHAFFHSPVRRAHMHASRPYVRTASDLPFLHKGVSLLCARGTRRILHHCRDSKRTFGIFAFFGMTRVVKTWGISGLHGNLFIHVQAFWEILF